MLDEFSKFRRLKGDLSFADALSSAKKRGGGLCVVTLDKRKNRSAVQVLGSGRASRKIYDRAKKSIDIPIYVVPNHVIDKLLKRKDVMKRKD
jgi:hypothetical protein